uniref:Peroxisomal bifunctional enzyme n=1 Tax=Biomphalaria glabrata TaxID=6526 RepID=A0A2C9KW95_BIOGL
MVDYRVDNQFAVLEINNPPVNALSSDVTIGLYDGILKALQDDSVQAVIIIGKGKVFCAGADITAFSKPIKGLGITDVGHAIESSSKPVISAVYGVALGGGLEIALFCHYRISDKKAKFGFPEVQLGLLPGAEGTIRLPRLTGLPVAMEIITSGRQLSAQEAVKCGIVDKIVENDLLQEAKTFATSIIGKPLDSLRLRTKKVKNADLVDKCYDDALKEVKRKYKGLIAPVSCLKTIRGSATLPYDAAAQLERSLFTELITSSQSAALRYSFFAERSAAKWRLPNGASSANTKPGTVVSAAVIGAGTMGSGIAVCLLRAGIPVILVEQNEKLLKAAQTNIDQIFRGSVQLGKMTLEKRQECLRMLQGTAQLEKVKDVDIVIEAIFENLKLKQEVFAKLDKICKPTAFLCSNTSTLDIDKIASATSRPDKVAGTHFFAPAHIMRLLENVYGSKTSPETVATVMELGRKIGKVSVLSKTCDGFIANRMNKIGVEAVYLVEEGASPYDIDQIMEDFGMSMGVFKVLDLSGLDVGWRIRQEQAKALGVNLTAETKYLNAERYCSLPDKLYELGRNGIKTGRGWYRYDPANPRKPIPDLDVLDIIQTHCQNLGIKRREITAQEVIERCLYATINEGFKILEENVAEKPSDIDVIWQYGFAFPRYRGGPMFYASQVGLRKVFERICYYHATFPYSKHWLPSDLLRKLASSTDEIPINQWMNNWSSKL